MLKLIFLLLAWKFRELQRLKRDREAREAEEAEQAERDRRRAMTEEERIRDNELNPKIITNAQNKGKMKFLMKYYHRGAFYMDKEEDILKVLLYRLSIFLKHYSSEISCNLR